METGAPEAIHIVFELWAWLLVILLSILGVAGNVSLYELGKQGLGTVTSRFPRINPARFHRAGDLLKARGSWILLLSCVPGLGIVLSTAAGAFGTRMGLFLLWVLIAKVARNWLLLIIAANLYYSVVG